MRPAVWVVLVKAKEKANQRHNQKEGKKNARCGGGRNNKVQHPHPPMRKQVEKKLERRIIAQKENTNKK